MVLVFFLTAIVVFNNTFPFALNLAISLVSVLAVYEVVSALGLSRNLILLVPCLVFAAALPMIDSAYWREFAYFLYTLVVFGALIFYHSFITFREVGVIYSMSLLIPTALETVVSLRSLGGSHGMFYVIIAIFSSWIADVGAFTAGSLFGRHKLCPDISPKKTVEGVFGAFVLDIAAMLLFGYLFQAVFYARSESVSYLSLFLIGCVGAGLATLGDLSFSLIKRSCHIKDFSEIIPGHGGILDRFDSVIFVAPFVYFLVQKLPIVL
jgi:phosphatidate cytidylyltransferase